MPTLAIQSADPRSSSTIAHSASNVPIIMNSAPPNMRPATSERERSRSNAKRFCIAAPRAFITVLMRDARLAEDAAAVQPYA